MRNDIVILSIQENSTIAKKLARNLNADLIFVDLCVFSDGENKIRFDSVTHKNCIIVHSTFPPIDQHLIQLFMMIYKCEQDNAKNICTVIPYLAYSRQDKSFINGEVISIDLLGKIFKSLGTNQLITVDIHNLDSLKFSINAINLSAMPLLANYAIDNLKLNCPIIVSPDKGGIKRAKDFADMLKTDMFSFLKIRDRYTGEVTINTENNKLFYHRDVIIIDDMISTGYSIIKASEVLKNNHVGDIYVMCTHALLLDDATDKLMNIGIKEIISTNSIPNKFAKVDLSSIFTKYFLSIV